MIWRNFTVLFAVVLFSACSKDELDSSSVRSLGGIDDDPPSGAIVKGMATPWESAQAWSFKDSSNFRVFHFNRPLPEMTNQILNDGFVSVWTKYAKFDAASGLSEQPAELPFFTYSENERPKFVEYWETSMVPGSVKVHYKTSDHYLITGNANPNAKVQFRYFMIPPGEMAKRQLTRDDVKRMTYQQLITVFGVSE